MAAFPCEFLFDALAPIPNDARPWELKIIANKISVAYDVRFIAYQCFMDLR